MPSSRAEAKKGACVRRKARGFPQGRWQSRFYRDFDAPPSQCLAKNESVPAMRDLILSDITLMGPARREWPAFRKHLVLALVS